MEQLGIEPIQLATQVFNFVIMAVLLTKFLYKPILKTLKVRREKIAEGLSYSEKMKTEAEKTEVKRQVIVNSAKEEARTIIEEAKKAGKLVESEIIENAHKEVHSMVEKGRSDLALERAEMEKRLKEQAVDIAEAIAIKVLAGNLTAKNHRSIIDKKIRTVAKQLSHV